SGRPSFAELVQRVKRVAVEAFAHQAMPFERLVEELAPARSLAYAPLVQVMFKLDEATPTAALPDLAVEETEEPTAKFDLTLGLEDGGDGCRGAFEYRTDLFDHETIARMAIAWTRLLRSAATDPA